METKQGKVAWVAYKFGDIQSGNWCWAVGFPPPHERARHSQICTINSYALRRTEYDCEQVARLFAAAPDMLAALKDLLGDLPSVQGGLCIHCGRDYTGDILTGECPSDDCPAFIARAAIAKAERSS